MRQAALAVPAVWSQALEDPALHDLPYKVETNEHGQLILSPHKLRHSLQQSAISLALARLVQGGTVTIEFAVLTLEGVKVPDVVWLSPARFAALSLDAEASEVMPEIVIEVLSKSNSHKAIDQKRRLYLSGGAQEVWLCDSEGRLTFFAASGKLERSALVPDFPQTIE